MKRWKEMTMALAVAALFVPAAGQAQKKDQAQTKTPRAAKAYLDVEELNDAPYRYIGKTVAVEGEVEDLLNTYGFVLESGGLINDEIAVIVPPKVAAKAGPMVEDAEVVVTGTVRAMTVIEIEREMGWDLDPKIEVEFDRIEYYLVADRITPKRDS